MIKLFSSWEEPQKKSTPQASMRGMYKMDSFLSAEAQPGPTYPRQEGMLIGYVGTPSRGRLSHDRGSEHVERLQRIDDDTLAYNMDGRHVLVRLQDNDRSFDCYTPMPFTKGVTERLTGRTMLILGSDAHHIEAMQGQFEGAGTKFGNTIRWINVGDTIDGFIGLDYRPNAKHDEGVATSFDDVRFLASVLLEFGYDEEKRLYILSPPHIKESEQGRQWRGQGLETLVDYTH